MDGELLKVLVDAGIGVFSVAVIAYLFKTTMNAHKHERKEWKESNEKQSEKVTNAIDNLARSIRNQP